MSQPLDQIRQLKRCGVVPVLTIPALDAAIPLASALVEGGLDVIEVTLRTPCALDAIGAIKTSGLDVLVGAGTILNEGDVDAATKAGSDFLVTPATPPGLVPALQKFDGLVIPGVSTTTEMLSRYEEGFTIQKLFPAELSGGTAFLKAVRAPLPDIRFMPTGGLRPENISAYLELDNVLAAGGTWIAPASLVETCDWSEITGRARAAVEQTRAVRNGG